MSLVLTCNAGGNFKPHPEGIHAVVCVDVVDLGLVRDVWQGQVRMVHKIKIVFESEARGEDGTALTISRNFSASLHPKASLCDFLGKWRGRPLVDGESIDFANLIGANATLVISHQANKTGVGMHAEIDAISKPTRGLRASGGYDPVEMRRKLAEWIAKQNQGPALAAPVAAIAPAIYRSGPLPASAPAVPVAAEAAPSPFFGAGVAAAPSVLGAAAPVVGPAPVTILPAVPPPAGTAADGDDDVPF